MEIIVKHIVNKMLCENMISEEETEWFLYSVQIVIEKVLGYASILLLSVLFDCFFQTIGFILVFSGIRKYSGGFHMKKSWTCYVFSIGVYIMFVAGIRKILPEFTVVSMLVLLLICLGIYVIGAVNCQEIHWTYREYINNAVHTRISIVVIYGVICGLKVAGVKDSYLWFMTFGVFLSFGGLVVQKIKTCNKSDYE